MRKVFSVLLSLVLCLSVMFGLGFHSVYAESTGSCGDSVTYSYDTSTGILTLTGTGATKDYLAGNTSISRTPWYSDRLSIITVIVGEGITSLGNYLLSKMTNLTTVILPSTLITISGYTFYQDSSLKSVNFSETSLSSIGLNAFEDCTSLVTVTLPETMQSIDNFAFRNAGVKTVNFPENCTAIGNYAFYGCSMSTVSLPETITSIGVRAFANNTYLLSVYVYNADLTYGGNDPFDGCQTELTFYGHKGSTTESYAEEKGYHFVSIDACDHETTHTEITVAATCTEAGNLATVCSVCGQILKNETIAATGHTWVLIEKIDDSDTDGHKYSYYQCSGCNEEKEEMEHVNWISGCYEYSTTATCTSSGVETYTCNICGKVQRNIIIGGGHTADENGFAVTVEPTCTEPGEQTATCSVCGEVFTQTISALGHDYVLSETVVDEEYGHTYYLYKCSVCSNENIEIQHDEWIEGSYTSTTLTEPGCVIDGIQLDTCTLCSKTRIVTIPANGQHEWYVTTETEPTCTAAGKIYYACSNCSLTRSETIEALGHDYVLSSFAEPTCTAAGSEIYKCSRCSASKSVAVAALGHMVDENNQTVQEATCTEDGSVSSVCTVCGETFTQTISALGHDYQDVITELEDKPGHSLVTPTCSRCSSVSTASVSHDEWIEGYYSTFVITSPSCIMTGISRDTCSICSETRNNVILATGHSYVSTGYDSDTLSFEYTCVNCSQTASYTAEYITGNFRDYVGVQTDQSLRAYIFDLDRNGIVNMYDYVIAVKPERFI